MQPNPSTLKKRSQSRLRPFNHTEDVRGRTLLDANNEEIGTVIDLLIDTARRVVRFLQVGLDGISGGRRGHVLIPVEAVESLRPDGVRIRQTREWVRVGPVYPADSSFEGVDFQAIYHHFGYAPYSASDVHRAPSTSAAVQDRSVSPKRRRSPRLD